jgi:endonuclease/exonuclease/phosphatase family metal-dependent hydrolase
MTGSGLLIFCKNPIIQVYEEIFTESQFPDSLSNKGFMCIEILANGRNVAIYNTHLQSKYSQFAPNIECIQTKQMQCIFTHIAKTYDSEHPVIVCGDMNCSGDNLNKMFRDNGFTISNDTRPTIYCVYNRNTRAEVTTFMGICDKCKASFTSDDYVLIPEKVDHIFLKNIASIPHNDFSNLLKYKLSDHEPCYIHIT